MLTGQQKAQILLSLLDETSNDVLSHLPEKSAKIMTSILDDTPDISDEDLNDLLNETFMKIDDIKKEQALTPAESSEDDLSSLEIEEDGEENNDPPDISLEEDNKTESETQEDEIENKEPYNENYRHPKKIASILESQNTQLTAFFLRNCDEAFRERIEEFLSEELKEKVQSSNVVLIPSSKRIFDSMFDEIVLKKEDDEEDEKNEEASEENASDDIFSF